MQKQNKQVLRLLFEPIFFRPCLLVLSTHSFTNWIAAIASRNVDKSQQYPGLAETDRPKSQMAEVPWGFSRRGVLPGCWAGTPWKQKLKHGQKPFLVEKTLFSVLNTFVGEKKENSSENLQDFALIPWQQLWNLTNDQWTVFPGPTCSHAWFAWVLFS